ncbi:hypothetical protein FVB9288_00318 [Flavobacterium sp. CECT 9288]|nr:transposase [Flavobacterium sp. CECT 9288]CAH0334713.1 hypothetical protein FVB9288_00318 [Flavobacterium sp. CECT 9288]
MDALQEISIKHRWKVMEEENKDIIKAKLENKTHSPRILVNGDTLKQLLARSRYLLYKNKSKWSENQIERATLLFELYPDIEKAYNLAQELRNIFEKTTDKIIGLSRLAKWHEKVSQSGFKSFNTISRSIINQH